MPSPFPGMDPYLEAHWGDIHHAIVNYARDAIQEQLPNQLFARMEERVYIETPAKRMARYPDVRIVESETSFEHSSESAGEEVMVAEPKLLELEADPKTEGFIEIREVGGEERLVTVIEVLSPANKTVGAGHWQYQRKQKDCQCGQVSLVEIDLLRGGTWTVLAPEDKLPEPMRSPYRISVWRQWRPVSLEFYHAPLRKRLPAIRIPLRDSDSDVALDLQALIDRAYRFGRYERTDYSVDPAGPLANDDATWLDALLREQGVRR